MVGYNGFGGNINKDFVGLVAGAGYDECSARGRRGGGGGGKVGEEEGLVRVVEADIVEIEGV